MLTKTKTKKTLLAVSALVGTLALGGVALARPGGPGHHGRGGPMKMLRLMEGLDLTEQQELELVRIRRALREERRAARAEMQARVKALVAELDQETPNPQLFHAFIDDVSARRTKAMHDTVDRFLKLHATLTPAQRAELSEKLERIERFMERRGKRFGPMSE